MQHASNISSFNLEANPGPYLFILEARNRVERNVLEKRVHAFAKDNDLPRSQYETVVLPAGEQSGLGGILKTQAPSTQLVPMRLVWKIPDFDSRRPVRLRHYVFGDPRTPGNIRARWMLLRNPERAELLLAAPASVSDLTARFQSRYSHHTDSDNEEFSQYVARQAVIALDVAERSVQGARYKLPRYVAETLTHDPAFQDALTELSQSNRESIETIRSRAAKYMQELIARPSPLFVDMRARVDQSILKNAYEGEICYHKGDADKLRSIMQTYPTLLLFTHKTYIDGSTPSNMLFEHDLPTAHLFGGQNLDFFGIGNMMRKMGIIFIRRNIKDNPLYKTVLRHYIAYLLSKRFPMSWSFEGTRSRIGKLMPPRYGLLKYVLDSAHDMDIKDIRIVPVVTSFDFIRDVEDYAREEVGGKKKPESLGWMLKFMKTMREPMGRIYADLGDPVIVKSAPAPDDKLGLSKIAFNVAVNANKATPLTLTALMCHFLLQSAPRGMTSDELQIVFPKTLEWAADRNLRLAGHLASASAERVDKTLNLLIERGVIERHGDTDPIYIINPDKHAQASYYRNTIIHHFLPKATIELALLKAMETPGGNGEKIFWDEVFRLRDLFKFEFFYAPKGKYRAAIKDELTRSDSDWEKKLGGTFAQQKSLLGSFKPVTPHAVFLQFTEAYIVVFGILSRLKVGEQIDKNECVLRALEEGRRAYLLRRITSSASISKTIYSNAFELAKNSGLCEKTTQAILVHRKRITNELGVLLVRMEKARLQTISDIEIASSIHTEEEAS